MTNQQIEKAKNDYAQSIIDSFGRSGVPCGISDIRGMIADGFKAGAQHALSRQWVSVEDALPEEGTMVTVHSPNGRIDVLKYHDGEFIDELGQAHCVDYFITIPQF